MAKLSLFVCTALCSFFLVCIVGHFEHVKLNVKSSDIRLNSTAAHRIKKRIVGGRYVDSDAYSFTIFGLLWGGSKTCTGTFIASNYILTAAHCCLNNGKFETRVLEIFNQLHGYVEVEVVSYFKYSDYNVNGDLSNSDIAIIQVVPNFIEIIPAYAYTHVTCGEAVWAFGHGQTQLNVPNEGKKLKHLFTKIPDCNLFTDFWHWLTKPRDMIITFSSFGCPCKGDSGGPVFNQYNVLVGVISGGNENCQTGEYDYAVRLSSHKEFLNKFGSHYSSAFSLNTFSFHTLIFSIFITLYFNF